MERTEAAHLLRRAGFGGTPDEIDAGVAAGLEACIDSLLSPPADDEFPALTSIEGKTLDMDQLADVQSWWTYRMVHTEHPLLEKMTLFWHGHFATSNYKVERPRLLLQQNQTLRRLAFGDFLDLLTAMSKDPAMLIWLDGMSNHRYAPNENWARELMELFTIGVGLYTEQDVAQSAAAFTGWGMTRGRVRFDSSDHVPGDKHFLGHVVHDGADVLAILADHPETGTFLSTKLLDFFGIQSRSLAIALGDVYRTSHRNIRAVLRALLLSPEFWAQSNRMAHIKSPAEFVIGCMRLRSGLSPLTSGTASIQDLHQAMARMGQELFNPPTVKGWDPDMAWISSLAMVERFNVAAQVATHAETPASTEPLEYWRQGLVQGPILPARETVVRGCQTAAEMAHLLMCLPEFQFC